MSSPLFGALDELAGTRGVTHALAGWSPRGLLQRSGSCGICGAPAEAVYSYQEEKLYLLPVMLDIDVDGMPPEVCCAGCTYRRHGVRIPAPEERPS